MESRHLIAKELSWLSFNERVLQEAADHSNPVLERFRFLGIFSSNQDEFFKVSVASVRRKSLAEGSETDTDLRRLMSKMQHKLVSLTKQFDSIYADVISEMAHKKVFFINQEELSDKQSRWLDQHFEENILRHIVPIWVTDKISLDEHLVDEVTYLVVEIKHGDNIQVAIIDVPDRIPRFITVPADRSSVRNYHMVADEVIRHSLHQIFSPFVTYDSLQAWSMKFSRDSEYTLDTDLDMSIVEKLVDGVKSRKSAEPVRLSYDREMPDNLVILLSEKLGIEDIDSVIAGGRYRNFRDFISFQSVDSPKLEFAPMPAIKYQPFDTARNIFEAINESDALLYYPYHRFSYFTEFVRQAAADPDVTDIKINIYRVAPESRVMESILDAARNAKNITVNIELRARFDEEHNLEMTEMLAESKVKVTLGISGLKVHSKLCVVTRNTEEGPKQFAVIATGNFNEKTAKIYTDFAFFTANQEICAEANSVFNFIEKPYIQPKLKHLWVSPINTRKNIIVGIKNEIDIAKAGGKGRIRAKMNNLVDSELSALLYKASNAGVQIELLIRGMCEIKPGVKGLSENIHVISIVDRFLEHARVFVFYNDTDPKVYISSADWMSRNLDDRVEVTCPIYDEKLKKQILDMLDIQFRDNIKARLIDSNQTNQYVPRGNKRQIRSQEVIYDYLKP